MKNFSERWENAVLENQYAEKNKQKYEDTVRNFFTLISHHHMSQCLSRESFCHLYTKAAEQYAEYIDSTEEQGGLNNYAAGALALLCDRPTECDAWKSSLSLDSPELQCMTRYRAASQAVKTSQIPPGREDDLLLSSVKRECGEPVLHAVISPTSSDVNLPTQVSNPGHSKPTTGVHQPCSNKFPLASSFHQPPSSESVKATNRPAVPDMSTPHNFLDIYRQDTRSKATGTSTRPVEWSTSSASSGSFGHFKQTESGNGFSGKRSEASGKRVHPDYEEGPEVGGGACTFRTARQQLAINNQKTHMKKRGSNVQGNANCYGANKKSLGTRRGVNSRFVPPLISANGDEGGTTVSRPVLQDSGSEEPVDERLKNIDSKMVELIMSEIMDQSQTVTWDDIAGLQFAKKTIQEIVVWPMLRPDIFTGLRGPPKGLLLFGPPGTGKTLIGKCIASQSKSTFFSISASSLTSKWVGEGEKMVRALFAVARVHQPAVVFIDEIDSLLSQRSDGEHESSRRIKTEFLVQLDGASTGEADRILVIGATNRPQELDEAARRRFVKRLYIPLPENVARQQIVTRLMTQQKHALDTADLHSIMERSKGYSGADMANLCREAALGPIRCMPFCDIETMTAEQVRPIMHKDFVDAFKQVRASVSEKDLSLYVEWNKQYGSWDIEENSSS